jgi:glycerate dehydrogenase
LKAVFLDWDTVSKGDLDPAQLRGAVDELVLFDSDPARTVQRLEGVQVVLVNSVTLDGARIAAAPDLKVIATAGTGTNHIDVNAAAARGIAVLNVRAYCTAAVTQQVWALILALTQHVADYDALTRDGSWGRDESGTVLKFPIRELAGRVFGVIGWGELGQGAARIAEAFGMQVLIAGRGAGVQPGRTPLGELLESADIVSLHCPLTPETRGLIGAAQLGLMKPDALLINTARGGLIDSAALAKALKARRLGGAGLDVMATEPPQPDDPLLEPGIPNLLITPHVAWAAREARQRCIDDLAASIQDFRAGGRRGRVV